MGEGERTWQGIGSATSSERQQPVRHNIKPAASFFLLLYLVVHAFGIVSHSSHPSLPPSLPPSFPPSQPGPGGVSQAGLSPRHRHHGSFALAGAKHYLERRHADCRDAPPRK